jgi:hypothetical protein
VWLHPRTFFFMVECFTVVGPKNDCILPHETNTERAWSDRTKRRGCDIATQTQFHAPTLRWEG